MITLDTPISELNAQSKGTLMEQLGIEYLEIKDGYVKAQMPVDHRTKQPFDILHGGASLALAETVASLGSALLVDLNNFDIRGASVTSNHVGAVRSGVVFGEARIIHRGKMTHVWDVDIKNEQGVRASIARVTVMVVPK
ncbi:MAG TPA: hotdog fold thioesterase [Bacteroidales bacterium]|nr:hotdog fold thioesterase [Bacteroidales bacterium]HRX95932.1 hotdog fold thioesterase [Bacteroidales bacterium]